GRPLGRALLGRGLPGARLLGGGLRGRGLRRRRLLGRGWRRRPLGGGASHWGGEMKLDIAVRSAAEGDCARYAAYVRMPPENGTITLVICPQFTGTGTRELRALTILHELVHVVAGPDECRAMSFAAAVEELATGRHTNVERYWRANGCEGSGFRL